MSLAAYTRSSAWMHWLVAFPLIGSVGTVLKAQDAPKEEKGMWMFRHKSLGLLTGIMVAPRLINRVVNWSSFSKVAHVEGTNTLERLAADASHVFLYAFMTIMPITGIAMGYYGGKGLPFFYTTFTFDESATNGAIAKQNFSIHKTLGKYGKPFIPLHVLASFQHYFRGHAIFSRINPFRVPRG